MDNNNQNDMKLQINDLEARIIDLKTKAKNAGVEVKVKLDLKINNLDAKKQALQNRLSELRDQGENTLNKFRNNIANTSNRMK